jgi:succinylglutamate desuccinylase
MLNLNLINNMSAKKAKIPKEVTLPSTESTISVPVTKADVPETLKQLKAQLAKLKGEAGDEKISLEISYQGTKISSIKSIKKLMEISASIMARAAAYDVEVKRYSLEGKVEEFSADDYSAAHWTKVISRAVTELINETQIAQLENAIKELSEFLSDEEKLANKLANIMQMAAKPLS